LRSFNLSKHTKLNLHDVNIFFHKKTINEGQKLLPFHEIFLPWNCIGLYAQSQELTLHKNPHSKEMGYDGVDHTHIHHRNSSHGSPF